MHVSGYRRSTIQPRGLLHVTCPLLWHEQVIGHSSSPWHNHPSYIHGMRDNSAYPGRSGRGRLTLQANIPLEVIAVLAKDVNLIHLLARCRQRQLDRHNKRKCFLKYGNVEKGWARVPTKAEVNALAKNVNRRCGA